MIHDTDRAPVPVKLIATSDYLSAPPDQRLWHNGTIDPGGGLVVGWIDTGAAYGKDIVACQACHVYYGILLLGDHLDDSDCLPRYERGAR